MYRGIHISIVKRPMTAKNLHPKAWVMLTLISAFLTLNISYAQNPWQEMDKGLEYGQFKATVVTSVGDSIIHVLRIDPAIWDVRLLAVSQNPNGKNLSAKQWCEQEGLVAAINAGMFNADYRTHTGFMKTGDHLNNSRANDYQSAAAFGPIKSGLPEFRIFDLDETSLDSIRSDYTNVIQNLRLVKRPGANRWSQQEKKWSEAALAEDTRGRVLFVFCRSPYTMHDFNQILLSLPIDIVAAQHLEGGPEAQLFVKSGDTELALVGSYETNFYENNTNVQAWPIPNAVGLARRER